MLLSMQQFQSFHTPLIVVFFAVAATALAAYLGQVKIKPKITALRHSVPLFSFFIKILSYFC